MKLFYYNKQKQLIKEEDYKPKKRANEDNEACMAGGRITVKEFKKLIKDGTIDKLLNPPLKRICTRNVNNKKYWEMTSDIKYFYNNGILRTLPKDYFKGIKFGKNDSIEDKITTNDSIIICLTAYKWDSSEHNIDFQLWDIQTWFYDSLKRVLRHRSYVHDHSSEKFFYFQGGYKYILTKYDNNGTPRQHKQVGYEGYEPQYTTTYYLDNNNRVIKKITVNEKGELVDSILTTYNVDGRISKQVIYDKNGLPEITHIYVYY